MFTHRNPMQAGQHAFFVCTISQEVEMIEEITDFSDWRGYVAIRYTVFAFAAPPDEDLFCFSSTIRV
jgi:hypothetical protein